MSVRVGLVSLPPACEVLLVWGEWCVVWCDERGALCGVMSAKGMLLEARRGIAALRVSV